MRLLPLRSVPTVFQKFEHEQFLLIIQQPGYPSGRNFSKHRLVFYDGLAGHYAMNECISFLFVVRQQCFRNLNTSSFLLITLQPGYPSGRNFSKQQVVFEDGLHAPIADTHTKLLTNFNHSQPTIAFNKVTNHCDSLWGDACLWASLMTCVLRGIFSSTKLFMPEFHLRLRQC